MSEMQAHHEAETRSDVAGTPAGVPGPLKDAGGSGIPYGWKPRTTAAGMFPSTKNGCDELFSDKFQLAFAHQAERTPMVEWYEARPTSFLGILSFDCVSSFETSTSFSDMLVEISEFGTPNDDEEDRWVAEIREFPSGLAIVLGQFTTFKVSCRKIFGRSRSLRRRTHDYWLRGDQEEAASIWAKFKSPWQCQE